MGNCGCKPCSKPLPASTKTCKPFKLCVGNFSLIWDGKCASIQPRAFQIPNGTYTSITFTDGCITGVGQAPLPQYTPQQCCDGEVAAPRTSQGSGSLSTGNEQGNLTVINNGSITVKPVWDARGNIAVTGLGTADKPWKPSVKISKQTGNTLVENQDGLFANLFFQTTSTVEVTGTGIKSNPYKLNVKGAEAKLPTINKDSFEGNGFTIDEQGRWKFDDELKLVSNLKFEHKAFKVMDQGAATAVFVDDNALAEALFTAIAQSPDLKQRLKTMLGV